jgi:hypothetical protein
MGDRDIWCFLVNEHNRINDGSELGMGRGFFMCNSEVKEAAFTVTMFLYRYICGNHICNDVSNVAKIWVKHVGLANSKAFGEFKFTLKEYANSSSTLEEAKIKRAREFQIAASKDEVLDFIFGKRIASRKTVEAAYDIAEQYTDTDGSPRSSFGLSMGMTRLSQNSQWADERNDIDIAAGRVLALAL